MSTPRGHHPGVHALRGWAALAVVLWHSHMAVKHLPGGSVAPVSPFLAHGYAAVDVFFCISGFVICHAARGLDLSAREFVLRRVARIYPLYWVLSLPLLAVVVVDAMRGGGWFIDRPSADPLYLLLSLAAFPQERTPLLGVGWSLEHELVFYAIFGTLLALGRERWLVPLLVVLSMLAAVKLAVAPDAWDAHLLSPHQIQFLAGVLVWHARAFLARLPALPLAVAAAVAWGAACLHFGTTAEGDLHPLERVCTWGGVGALILAALLAAERTAAGRLFDARPIILVGSASYALYLSHPLTLSVTGKLAGLAHLPIGVEPMRWAAVALAIAVALVLHRAVELPLNRALLARARRLASPRTPRPPLPPPGSTRATSPR